MSEGRTRVTVSLAPEDVTVLRQTAARLRLMGTSGQGSLTALLRGIADGSFAVVPRHVVADWSFVEGTVVDVQRRIEQVGHELEGVREVIGAAK